MNQLAKKNLVFGTLLAIFHTPVAFCMMGLPMILQIKGFDASVIGIFQLLWLPTMIKFLLSTPVDKFVFHNNHYKKWIVFTGVFYSLSLVLISFLSLDENIYLVFGAILLTILLATFIDIPLNALAIKIFKEEERISAGSYKISAYFAAGLLGGGILLLVYNHLGWQSTFIITSFMVLCSLFSLFFIIEHNEIIEEEKVSLKTLITFFKQKEIGMWVFVLMFYYAFLGPFFVFLKPYLISEGFSPDEVASYVGIYGGIIGFLGGIVASIIGKKYHKKTLLILFGTFNILSAAFLVCIEYLDILNFAFFIAIVTSNSIALAFSSAIIFSLIMDYSRSSSKAIDYSLQTSLFSLTRVLSAVGAGMIVSAYGFGTMFIFETLGMIVVLFIIYKFYKVKQYK